MKPETVEEVTFERCAVCKGIFLDKGEFEKLLEDGLGAVVDTFAFSAVSETMDALQARCPKCARDMAATTGPGGLRLDRCPGCEGVFLDQGELASLQLVRG